MPALLPVAATLTTSATATILDGMSLSLALFNTGTRSIPVNAEVDVQIASGSVYTTIATLNYNKPTLSITSPGTYRVQRNQGTVGVFLSPESV